MELLTVGIMMFISGTVAGNVVNAANNVDADSGKVVYKKSKEYEPKKKSDKAPTIFGWKIEKVKPR